jgi:hypothetical protein
MRLGVVPHTLAPEKSSREAAKANIGAPALPGVFSCKPELLADQKQIRTRTRAYCRHLYTQLHV